jgi:type IV secretion system protein VirB5
MLHRTRWFAVVGLMALSAVPVARAQIPVTDVGAIVQLIAQLEQLQQQLTVARDTLRQAEDAYESMTGQRGMERLLDGAVRNYLPEDWLELERAMRGASAAQSALAREINRILEQNAVLSEASLGAFAPADRGEIDAARRSAAMLQALSSQALANTSEKFGSLDELIRAIGRADDPKAISELQARIGAEQGMLQNEANKLFVLHQAAQAQELTRRQRERERAIAGVGRLRDRPSLGLSSGT